MSSYCFCSRLPGRVVKLVLFFLLSGQALLAETVLLRSGAMEKGKVTSQNEKTLTLTKPDGKTIDIPKTKILKVIYQDVSEAEALKIKEEAERKEKAKAEKEKLASEEEEKKKEKEKLEKERIEADALEKIEKEKREKEQPKLAGYEPSPGAVECGSRFAILWRSALVPGWGQYCAGYKVSGALFFAGSFLSLYNAEVRLAQEVKSAEANYDRLSLIYQFAGPLSNLRAIDLLSTDLAGNRLLETSIWTSAIDTARNDFREATVRQNANYAMIVLLYITNLVHAYAIGRDRPVATSGWFLDPEGKTQVALQPILTPFANTPFSDTGLRTEVLFQF